MNAKLIVSCLFLANSLAAVAGGTTAQPAKAAEEKKPLTFFVTSTGLGNGANLGGLAGADAHCQALATTVGEGARTWRAYLSTQATDNAPAVNARDRIGKGPWHNAKGAVVAKDLAVLHGDTLDLARLGSNLSRNTVLTEKGENVKGAGDKPNQHDILTGSKPDGTAFEAGTDRTCRNYTYNGKEGAVQVGNFDRTGGGNTSWNSAHPSKGCGQEELISTGGAGLLYCFAAD